jgi:hypothetical protein
VTTKAHQRTSFCFGAHSLLFETFLQKGHIPLGTTLFHLNRWAHAPMTMKLDSQLSIAICNDSERTVQKHAWVRPQPGKEITHAMKIDFFTQIYIRISKYVKQNDLDSREATVPDTIITSLHAMETGRATWFVLWSKRASSTFWFPRDRLFVAHLFWSRPSTMKHRTV